MTLACAPRLRAKPDQPFCQLEKQLENTDVVISVLRLLVRLHDELASFDEKMESVPPSPRNPPLYTFCCGDPTNKCQCDYAAAAGACCDMREALQRLQQYDVGCDAQIFAQVATLTILDPTLDCCVALSAFPGLSAFHDAGKGAIQA